MKRWLREPLLHFLMLGGILFAFSAWRNRAQLAEQSQTNRIDVSAATIESLRTMWQRQYQLPPSEQELRGLVNDYVREQVLYREALALGLERDDSVVRRRLAQKMEFLTADIFEAGAPDDATLERYFQQHAEQYARPARASFRHVYFSRDKRGERAAADAQAALPQLAQGASEETVGDPFVGEFAFDNHTDREIGDAFGKDFAARVISAPLGQWAGPIDSSFGIHLVLVARRGEPEKVTLADVRETVQRDYQEQRRRQANHDVLERLRARYQIYIDDAAITSPVPELLKTAQVNR